MNKINKNSVLCMVVGLFYMFNTIFSSEGPIDENKAAQKGGTQKQVISCVDQASIIESIEVVLAERKTFKIPKELLVKILSEHSRLYGLMRKASDNFYCKHNDLYFNIVTGFPDGCDFSFNGYSFSSNCKLPLLPKIADSNGNYNDFIDLIDPEHI